MTSKSGTYDKADVANAEKDEREAQRREDARRAGKSELGGEPFRELALKQHDELAKELAFLEEALETPEFATLHTLEQSLLLRQRNAMREHLSALRDRITFYQANPLPAPQATSKK